MVDFVQNTIDGVMIGSSYGLLALGFTLIFGVMRRLNLSYGPSIMIGAYLGTMLHLTFDAGPLAVAARHDRWRGDGRRLCRAALLRADESRRRHCLDGVEFRDLDAARAGGGHGPAAPHLCVSAARHRRAVEFGPFMVRVDHLIMLACALALAAGLHLTLYRTRFGLALRAIIDQDVAAHLVGIDVRRAVMLAFAAASAIGGVAGFLVLAVDQQVTPMFGMWATLKGLIAMMIGGLGSVPGAVLGGLLLGVIEAHSQWYFGPHIRDLVAYFVLFAFLVMRPGGLLGSAPESATLRKA